VVAVELSAIVELVRMAFAQARSAQLRSVEALSIVMTTPIAFAFHLQLLATAFVVLMQFVPG